MTDGLDEAAIVEDEALPGLAGERTDLAWTRVGLSVLAAVAAVMKRTLHGFGIQTASAIVVALVIATVVGLSATLVYAQALTEAAHPGRNLANPIRMRRVAYGTTVFALAAAALALVPNAPS